VAVTVTNEPDSLIFTLGRIEGKLDSTLTRLDRHEQRVDEIEGRLTALEKGKAYLMGGAAAVAAIITFVKEFFLP